MGRIRSSSANQPHLAFPSATSEDYLLFRWEYGNYSLGNLKNLDSLAAGTDFHVIPPRRNLPRDFVYRTDGGYDRFVGCFFADFIGRRERSVWKHLSFPLF